MKRTISLLLVLLLLAALPCSAAAARVSGSEAAETLVALGLMRGTGKGLELDRGATRAEAVAMLLRLLGKESDANAETEACPFDDGGWAAPLLTYAWKNGLVVGQSDTHFGSAESVGCRDYVTMLLRALGYSDEEGDFSWQECIAFADAIGLCHGEYTADTEFLREDLALLSYSALTLCRKDTEQTLAERLYLDGVVSGSALRATRLAYVRPAEKPVYDAAEIHELAASAILFVEAYADEEALEKDQPDVHGSGFFITGDGIALMCYHELDGFAYARATTLDGHRYDVTGVLGYDPFWDYAVVRVSRTDLEGETVRFFPYLDVGDSDDVCAGEAIYTMSNALGLIDNITNGVLSNRARNVDDPDYLSLQLTAPISPGSSGGALLNRHGELIGILYGAFASGQSMNLAVPVNAVASVGLTGEGIPLTQVKQIEDEKKAAATLSVSETELELEYGQEAEVMVTHTAPSSVSIRYQIDGKDVVKCTWGSFVNKHSVPLTIEAIGNGEATVTITFAEDNMSEETSAVIHVTASGAPEEPEEELPSGVTGE